MLKWESAYLEVAKNISNRLQNEKNENTSLMFYYEAGRSFGDISGTSIFQDIDKLCIGIVLMFLYVLTILSKANWVEWRVSFSIVISREFVTSIQLSKFSYLSHSSVSLLLAFCAWAVRS